MATLQNFIASVWSARILETLHNEQIFTQERFVNRDYVGEIVGRGSTVFINSIGGVTVSDYNEADGVADPEQVGSFQQALQVNNAKAFNVTVGRIAESQSQVNIMEAVASDAAVQLTDESDRFVAAMLGDGSAEDNQIGSIDSPQTDLGTEGKAYGYLLRLKTMLSNNNTPQMGRYVIAPPWFEAALLEDKRFVSSGTPQGEDRLVNGFVGRAAGFDIYVSNNAHRESDGSAHRVVAGHRMAATYVQAILDVERYTHPRWPANSTVFGLLVFGGKVVRPGLLATLYANEPS